MFSPPQRRHAHSKRYDQPSLSDNIRGDENDEVGEVKDNHHRRRHPTGLFSYFVKAKRRLTKGGREKKSDTLLPTSYAASSSSTSSSTSPSKIRPLTCNNFLMGGHYYPGKDKKRRHTMMRRKTLWYRLFCSSPGRKVVSFLIVAYLLLWHVLLPSTEWLIQFAVRISAHHTNRRPNNVDYLKYDSSLNIPDMAQEQLQALELVAARAKVQLQPDQKAKRLKLLEQIVPKWFHRNNSNRDNNDVDRLENQQQKNDGRKKTESKIEEMIDEIEKDDVKPSIVQINGDNLVQRTLHTSTKQATQQSQCTDFIPHQDTFSTTLVTQTSLNRLWILSETCTRWKDPIIAVVFILHGQDKSEVHIPACPNLSIIQYMANVEESMSENYPVNRLRNVGLDAVKSSHVLVMDIDFVPSYGLDKIIRESLKLQQKHASPDSYDRQALVVPAFDRRPPQPCKTEKECRSYLQSDSSFIPSSFSDVQQCVIEKECIVFQSDNNWEGHSTTRSEQWLQKKWYDDAADKSTFKSIPCFDTARYEPYVVLEWCSKSDNDSDQPFPAAPYYDERFHGYGKNKIELISHLRKMGYHFSVLPEGFIVHNPHPESTIKETWNDRDGSNLHSSMDKLYGQFLSELEEMYKDHHEDSIKLCNRH